MASSRGLQLLKRNWFFVGVILALTLGWLFPDPVARLSAWTFGPYRVRAWLITIIMLFTAFTLPIRNIGAGARNWVGLVLMLAMSYGTYPLLTYGIARGGWWLQGVDPTQAPLAEWVYGAGLIIIAAVPTTMASGIIWTRQSGGDDALALVGMILALLCSIVITPLVLSWTLFPLMTRGTVEFLPGEMRLKLIEDLTKLILIPIVLGQLLRIAKPLAECGDRYRKEISIVLQLFVLITIWFSVAGQMATPAPLPMPPGAIGPVAVESPHLPGVGVLGFIIVSTLVIHLATLGLGWSLARMLGQKAPAVICVALNGAQKTLPVALLVQELLHKQWGPAAQGLDGAVWSFILVHVTQLSMDALLIPHFKGWSERQAARNAPLGEPGRDTAIVGAASPGPAPNNPERSAVSEEVPPAS